MMAKTYVSRPVGTKAVRLDLSATHHRRLRQLAAAANKPMSQFVRDLVEREIDRTAKHGGFPRES